MASQRAKYYQVHHRSLWVCLVHLWLQKGEKSQLIFGFININFFSPNLMQRSDGGGAFQALDTLNGKLLCGCDDVHACLVRDIFGIIIIIIITQMFRLSTHFLTSNIFIFHWSPAKVLVVDRLWGCLDLSHLFALFYLVIYFR